MKVKTYGGGALGTNCYIVSTEQSAVVIDPGFLTDGLRTQINESKGIIKGILLTHGHADHISAAAEVKEITGAPVAIHKSDSAALHNPDISLCTMMDGMYEVPKPIKQPEILLEGGETLNFDDIEVKVIYTPGHTIGGVCFLIDNMLFSGDTLFSGTVGRTDLPTGDYNMIKKSMDVLSALDNDLFVYPGHGTPSTIQREKTNNPYMVKDI